MSQEWLLIETLGERPVVVAQGRHMKKFVPLGIFLRRNPDLPAITAVIARTLVGGQGLSVAVPKVTRVIHTEPVIMTDGVVHGVHLWCGPAGTDPPQRPLVGAFVVDLDTGESSVTAQFLLNIGKDPASEPLTGRSMADDIPLGAFNEGEAEVLSWAVDLAPGRTFAAAWSLRDDPGLNRRVGFCVRITLEAAVDRTEHVRGRSMNLVESVGVAPVSTDQLATRLMDAMARPGHYRAIINLATWALIKWLDEPCPLYNWRARPQIHPDDRDRLAAHMREELFFNQTSAVLRLPAYGGGWTPVHVSIDRVELHPGVYAGLVTLRSPTPEELTAAQHQHRP